MADKHYRPATLLVHQGRDRDPATGASTVPIYQASTYHHPGGASGQYDYARSGNPSREQVEEAIALLEGGVRGFAYASGMAAIGSALVAAQERRSPGGIRRPLRRLLALHYRRSPPAGHHCQPGRHHRHPGRGERPSRRKPGRFFSKPRRTRSSRSPTCGPWSRSPGKRI